MSAHNPERLATVLRVRDLFERRAMGRLAAVQRQLAEAERRLHAREERYRERPVGPPHPSAEQLFAQRLLGMGAHDAVVAAAGDRDVVAHRREELAAALAEASIQRKSVERLAERRRHELAVATQRSDDLALDEMAMQLRARR